MKKSYIRQIIKEEYRKILNESIDTEVVAHAARTATFPIRPTSKAEQFQKEIIAGGPYNKISDVISKINQVTGNNSQLRKYVDAAEKVLKARTGLSEAANEPTAIKVGDTIVSTKKKGLEGKVYKISAGTIYYKITKEPENNNSMGYELGGRMITKPEYIGTVYTIKEDIKTESNLNETDLGAFRRMVITSTKAEAIQKDFEALLNLLHARSEFQDLKVDYKKGVTPNTIVVDINGNGATALANKFKPLVGKQDKSAILKIKNQKTTVPVVK